MPRPPTTSILTPASCKARIAPYMVPAWFKRDGASLTIFYTVSTWLPYQAVLMKTTSP